MPDLIFKAMDGAEREVYGSWFHDAELRRRIETPSQRFYDYVDGQPSYNIWMVYEESAPVGAVYLDVDIDVEGQQQGVALMVNPSLRNRSYGRRILRVVLERPEIAAARGVKVCIEPDNIASRRCFEATGFVAEDALDKEGFLPLVYNKDSNG